MERDCKNCAESTVLARVPFPIVGCPFLEAERGVSGRIIANICKHYREREGAAECVERCGDRHPTEHVFCTLPKNHSGNHASTETIYEWPVPAESAFRRMVRDFLTATFKSDLYVELSWGHLVQVRSLYVEAVRVVFNSTLAHAIRHLHCTECIHAISLLKEHK